MWRLSKWDKELKTDLVRVFCVTVDGSLVNKIAKHFSDWHTKKRVLAWFMKLEDFCRHRTIKINEMKRAIEYVKSLKITFIIRKFQTSKGDPINKSCSLRPLCPYLDCVVFHVGGPLAESEVVNTNPIIISGGHPIAKAIIRVIHARAHLGAEWTLSLIREKYLTTKARPIIKKLILTCVTCKRLFGKLKAHIMSDFSPEKIEPDKPPFLSVGVDVIGLF